DDAPGAPRRSRGSRNERRGALHDCRDAISGDRSLPQQPADGRVHSDRSDVEPHGCGRGDPRSPRAGIDVRGRRGDQRRGCPRRPRDYLVIVPHAMRPPDPPEGSVFMSSGPAWMTSAVPPLVNTELASVPSDTRGSFTTRVALPSASTVKLFMSPACG